ncbi:transglutaminase-like cysteine peptidase [Comamonas faecalis]|uniref:Transglutaminase-like cysteine peptidase n=2 Tax=Comamonas faecalis TaxID=1387849 RepID=A0ABP7QT35_9BURK
MIGHRRTMDSPAPVTAHPSPPQAQPPARGPSRRRWLLALGAAGICALQRRPLAQGQAQPLAWDEARLLRTMQQHYGAPGVKTLQAWLALLQAQAGQPLAQQLRAVNDFWNTTVLASDDPTIWGQADYWATPLQTLGRRAGDCEDFVIGKYFSLLRLGVPAAQLRLIYVRARMGGLGSNVSVAHMVLGHYASADGEPLVLDNLAGTIAPASQRPDLTPVFSFNGAGIYIPGARTTPTERIARWPDLLARMRQEGFAP